MEKITKKLSLLDYPKTTVPSQMFLFAGIERYSLLEWLFFKLLGDKSPFSQQNGTESNGIVHDEETARIQHLSEIAKFLGVTATLDIEAIQGRGSYDDRVEMLGLIVDLVEASMYADNPEWSVDEQATKDMHLIDGIAERQAQIFVEDCKLFPADVHVPLYPMPDISELDVKLSEQSKLAMNLQQKVDEMASEYPYNPKEDYKDTEARLHEHLASFLKTVKIFHSMYTKEVQPWTNMMEPPQLHGLGPVASRLLETYEILVEFTRNLRSIRESYSALIGCSHQGDVGASTLTRIISERESALVTLNSDLHILATSIAREEGRDFPPNM